MCDACVENKKKIEILERKVHELEKSKEFSSCDSVKEVILAEIKKTNQEQLSEIQKIVKENDKSDSNKNLLLEFKWIVFMFVMSFLLIGFYFIGVQKEFIGCMSILGAFIIAYCSVILINSKQSK